MKKNNQTKETIIPQSKTTTRKLEKQHLTLDSGIEIKIPMELYNNEDDIEFITNEDGTMSMIIKNINNIVSKQFRYNFSLPLDINIVK